MGKQYQLRGQNGPMADQIIKLAGLEITLGRDLSNDVVIADSEVSRSHARMSWQADGYILQDLRSTNGTWVNGHPVMTAYRLAVGDQVTLGKTSLFVYEPVPESEADTTRDQDLLEDGEPIESTMVMPAWQDEARRAHQVARARSVDRPATPIAAVPDEQPAVQDQHKDRSEEVLSPGKWFHQQYAAYLQAGALSDLLRLYHPDATLLSTTTAATGTAEITAFFGQYFGGPGRFMKVQPAGNCVEGPDAILCETSIETADAIARVQDTFVLREGKATHHFTYTLEITPRTAR